MKSQLQTDIERFWNWLKDFCYFFYRSIRDHPHPAFKYIVAMIYDSRLVAYLFGMACEAGGLCIQSEMVYLKIAIPFFGIPYPDPLGDAVVGFILMIVVMAVQERKFKNSSIKQIWHRIMQKD
jgi:hypothetical protein